MKTIELSDREILLLCTAIRVSLGQINPRSDRIELDPFAHDLNEWTLLNKKVSCDRCDQDDDDICKVCGAEWSSLRPEAADGLMEWVMTTGLYKRKGAKASDGELKEFLESCAKVRDSDGEGEE